MNRSRKQPAAAAAATEHDDNDNAAAGDYQPLSTVQSAAPPLLPPTNIQTSLSLQANNISQSFSADKKQSSSPCHHSQGRPYKGFSTPFCGLFQTSGGLPTADNLDAEAARNKSPMQIEHEQYQHNIQMSHLRTDICSLSCFGICQSDQTRYLFTQTRPPSFLKRMTYHIFIPVCIFLLAGWCSGNIQNEVANNITCTLLIYSIVVWYVLACFNGRRERIMVREEILWTLKRREEKIKRRQEERRQSAHGVLAGSGGGGGGGGQFDIPYNVASIDTETEYEYYSDEDEHYQRSNYDSTLGQTRFEMNCAHRLCGCYPSDIAPFTPLSNNMDNNNNDESDYILQQQTTTTDNAHSNSNGDLCTRIWNVFSSPCLTSCVPCCGGGYYGCHIQLCGFCALAQEAREANLILPRYLRMVDYITMEPFLLYYPRILELRRTSGSFWDHSLSCFGICQSDQTRYLFTQTRPPSFLKRMTYHIFIPVCIFLLAGWCSGNIQNEVANNITCTLLIYSIVVWYVLACFNGRRERIMVREEILWTLKRREEKIKRRQEERRQSAHGVLAGSGGGGGGGGQFDIPYNVASIDTETEYEYYSDEDEHYQRSNYDSTLGQTRFEMNCAHRLCGCYPSDIAPFTPLSNNMDNNNNDESDYILQQQTTTTDNAHSNSNGDLCTRIWNVFSSPCLTSCVPCCGGGYYGCHIQLCGFCALAQEAREANLILPRYLRMVDYITMEPFLLYYPRILELRRTSGSFWDHCSALSRLSRIILQTLAVILAAMLGISLISAIGYWNLTDMGVLGATFSQAFVVMYVVHWGWHRYDLSIDAVIKFFATGFLLW